MPSVADLVSLDHLADLATPANRRLGQQIKDEGGVALGDFGPQKVTATVGGTASSPTRRKVTLESTPGGLRWSCTCSRKEQFCKHDVAVALVTLEKAPTRRKSG